MENAAFLPIAPEVILLAGALVVILAGVIWSGGRRELGIIAGLALAVAFAFAVLQWQDVAADGPGLYFSMRGTELPRTPMVVMDAYSAFSGLLIFVVGFVGLLAAWKLVTTLGTRATEFLALLLLAVAGLHMMTASANLVMLFLALETASISFYVLAGFTRERAGADEAAIKYFLLGSLASAVFIYGVALAFAATGSTSLYGVQGIREFFGGTIVTDPGILFIAVALMIVGLSFKVAAAPFHQWAPDVYQGAPGGATGLLAAGVKVAGFAALGRVLIGGFPSQISDWAPAVAVVAAISMVVGVVMAIVQDDLKRLLAYSGVAHAGYILTALVAGLAGVAAMWFYLATYAFALLGAFAVAAVVSGARRGRSSLDSYRGLASRSPELAGALAVLMLGLAGFPFTAGFIGKVAVFSAAVEADYIWLVVLGVLTTVAGLYFYVRVITLMYMREPVPAEAPGTLRADPEPTTTTRLVLAVSVVVTIVFGLVPWPLLDFVRDALPI